MCLREFDCFFSGLRRRRKSKKGTRCSDSSGAWMSILIATDEHSPRINHGYSREFHSMLDGLDEEECLYEPGHAPEKKRRLSVLQVRTLEKNFEVENKLEPERKVNLAQELGLQPRQVAVWFQNRRARWKTKQLEKDYSVLKVNYDALKKNHESLRRDNEALLKEIIELKSSKLDGEKTERNLSVKEAANNNVKEVPNTVAGSEAKDYISLKIRNAAGISVFADFKDGLSDSDSSAILNEDNSPMTARYSSSAFVQNQPILMKSSSSFRFNNFCPSAPSSINCFKYSESGENLACAQKACLPQLVKLEEHDFFSGEEACNFFSDEQAPSLHWYSPDQWT
ncbi:hypothetical protein Nepgr_027145 [Nepenthes gracilis]|uniref:Homeobox-leucine zipper protein n=1 Tax=Nepenthes gracilis TaxID=150966 RepID=A0AAD3Y101_NEPGR|nr:hypothetical protein Nepgr_027145 [Nepenthes gracilis]